MLEGLKKHINYLNLFDLSKAIDFLNNTEHGDKIIICL